MISLQKEYKIIKSKVDSLRDCHDSYMEKFDHLLDSDEGTEKYVEISTENDIKIGLTKAEKEFDNIELKLLNWFKNLLKKDPNVNKSILDLLGHKKITVHNKLIDLALKVKL